MALPAHGPLLFPVTEAINEKDKRMTPLAPPAQDTTTPVAPPHAEMSPESQSGRTAVHHRLLYQVLFWLMCVALLAGTITYVVTAPLETAQRWRMDTGGTVWFSELYELLHSTARA